MIMRLVSNTILPGIDIFNDDGTLSEKARSCSSGSTVSRPGTKVVKKLEEEGLLAKEEDYVNKIGYSERTDAVIEPRLSMQWFLKMKEMARPALENVMNDNITLYPSKFKNTYRNWMENVRDWCISRQLWWGQRIPAYYIGEAVILWLPKPRRKRWNLHGEKRETEGLMPC